MTSFWPYNSVKLQIVARSARILIYDYTFSAELTVRLDMFARLGYVSVVEP